MHRRKVARLVTTLASLILVGCLDTQSGRVRDGDDGDARVADTTSETSALDIAEPDTRVLDTTSAPDTSVPTATLPPPGPWMRETIGDCIHFYDFVAWHDDGGASWRVDDDDYCSESGPDRVYEGTAAVTDDHVLALRFDADGRVPSEQTWTWAVIPGTPAQLHTAAFRRVPGTDRWRRDERQTLRFENDRSERRLRVDVTLVGYPEVTAMRVDYDVAQQYSRDSDTRGGTGTLEFPARRLVGADGRAKIAAAGYELDQHPNRYRFQQELMARYGDGYLVDLITDAFFPVLFEVEGDPASLVIEAPERVWTRQ